MEWIIRIVLLMTGGSIGYVTCGLLTGNYRQEMLEAIQERDDARTQRDRLNTRNAELSAQLADRDEEIARRIFAYDALEKDRGYLQSQRNEAIGKVRAVETERAALQLQLAEALQSQPEPPQEVQYAVKTPKRTARKKAE